MCVYVYLCICVCVCVGGGGVNLLFCLYICTLQTLPFFFLYLVSISFSFFLLLFFKLNFYPSPFPALSVNYTKCFKYIVFVDFPSCFSLLSFSFPLQSLSVFTCDIIIIIDAVFFYTLLS